MASLRSDAYVDQYGALLGWEWLLALSPTALLLLRRYAPASALTVATALYLAASVTQGDSNAPLAIPLFAYSVGLTRPPPVSAMIVGAAALAMSTTTFYGPGAPDALVIVVWFVLFASGWSFAVLIRRSQDRAEHLSRTVGDLEAQQAVVAAGAVADERSRIARELHDAVGHTVNVIVLQAGAARLSADPAKAVSALREIETLGRTALTDLDHLLGLLHDGEEASRDAARTTGDIAPMIGELRAAGADIALLSDCAPPVARHVGAAAFRIVQEALTNSLKHAPGAHVDVTLSCSNGGLHLIVANDAGAAAPHTTRGGRGIAGMAERARVLGGRLEAGPDDEGGFRVEAFLPLTPQDLVRPGTRAEVTTR